jgi:hypothetical protein
VSRKTPQICDFPERERRVLQFFLKFPGLRISSLHHETQQLFLPHTFTMCMFLIQRCKIGSLRVDLEPILLAVMSHFPPFFSKDHVIKQDGISKIDHQSLEKVIKKRK